MIEVYTASIGKRDSPRYDIKCFEENRKFKQDVMAAKMYKVLPHLFIDADYSIWLDANIYLRVPKEQAVQNLLGDADIAIFQHPYRDNIPDEARAVLQFNMESKETIDKLQNYYERHNKNLTPLYEGGVIIRRHSKKVEMFNNTWWSYICAFSHRDQLSLPVALKEIGELHGLKVSVITGNVRNHPYFVFGGHTGECGWK